VWSDELPDGFDPAVLGADVKMRRSAGLAEAMVQTGKECRCDSERIACPKNALQTIAHGVRHKLSASVAIRDGMARCSDSGAPFGSPSRNAITDVNRRFHSLRIGRSGVNE
jgi:hypothetical protein